MPIANSKLSVAVMMLDVRPHNIVRLLEATVCPCRPFQRGGGTGFPRSTKARSCATNLPIIDERACRAGQTHDSYGSNSVDCLRRSIPSLKLEREACLIRQRNAGRHR
jgi:hypothetical protein